MHLKTFVVFGAVVLLWIAGAAQADVPMNLMSYPNAAITVDGDASDWNLPQFGTVVPGGVAGTGDIALVGWDDTNTNLYYGGIYVPGGGNNPPPANKADHQAKVYARDNATTQYFLVSITDSDVRAPEAVNNWANDCVEFYIDPEDNGDPTNWASDIQLVIDANGLAKVWMTSPAYAAQIEAGVQSAVTLTADGWLLEVGIAKSVLNPALPSILGPVNDPQGNNYGLDLNFRDNDNDNDPALTTVYDWADPLSSGGFPSKNAGSWGDVVAPEPATLALLILGGAFVLRRRR
jgi:hypothetical protein